MKSRGSTDIRERALNELLRLESDLAKLEERREQLRRIVLGKIQPPTPATTAIEPKLGRMQARILDELRNAGPLTPSAIVAATGINPNTIYSTDVREAAEAFTGTLGESPGPPCCWPATWHFSAPMLLSCRRARQPSIEQLR